MRSIILLSLRINNHLFLTKEVKKNYYWDMSPFSTSSKRKKWSRDLLVILLLSGDAADRNFIVKNGGVSLHHTSAVNENPDDYDFWFPSDVALGNSAGLGDGTRCIIRPRGHSRNDHYMFIFDTIIYNIAILAHSYTGHKEHRVCLK